MNIASAALPADTWMHGGWGWGWMTLMMVMMVLFWGAVIAGIVWLIRGASGSLTPRGRDLPKETPAEVLDRRFAEGEISEEDYRSRRELLTDRGSTVGTA